MKQTPLTLSLALSLFATPLWAQRPTEQAKIPVAGEAANDAAERGDNKADQGASRERNKPSPAVKDLGKVDVIVRLDLARNALSPDTGGSQYAMSAQDIEALPLGAATPLNQVLLQAPGVVQDSYGGMHVRGDHANLQYRIDGVILPESVTGFGQALDSRMISSVKLLDGTLPAQYGLRSAAVVDITTKSGHELGHGGSVGMTAGSFGNLNPNASVWGSHERWSWFVTANFLQNDVGIESPTPNRTPNHDHTNQFKGFGNLSYLIDDDTRVSFMFGGNDNRYQIPNTPGRTPTYRYLDQTAFDSADLNQQQREKTRFGALALQGKLGGATDYQVSLTQRYSSVHYMPDPRGDLMFNGVAATILRANRASTLQGDFATPLGDHHTLRYGVYGSYEDGRGNNSSQVFPAWSYCVQGNCRLQQLSTTPITIVDNNPLTAKTWSAYLQDEWRLGERWTVNYGLRGDQYQLGGANTERQLSPRLGLVWQAGEDTTLHAGYARYFTPPATEVISLTSIGKFQNTTNQLPSTGNDMPLAERTHYFDVGVSHNLTQALTVGLDAYYKKINRLQDEGQFGAALIYSNFNYAQGRIGGVEFTVSYNEGPWSLYSNMAWSKGQGKNIITGEYNISARELAYLTDHWVYLDHDQRFTASGGASYAISEATKVGANYLFGTGLRAESADGMPNGASLPDYFQLNLSLSHDFKLPRFGKLHTQLAVINALDRVYQLRDGTGIGVGAPQYGPRRGAYLSVQKDFDF